MKHFTLLAGLVLGILSASAQAFFDDAELAEFGAVSNADSTEVVNHQAWSDLLGRYITDQDGINMFDYGGVSDADRQQLDDYLARLQAVTVSALNPGEQFAYWVNLYNAVTVDLILDHYPVDSIRDIKGGLLDFGPWKMSLVTVEGRELSLDDVEHGILRQVFADPRIHYVVNCASIGCPNLQPEALTAANREAIMTRGARQFINHPRGVSVDDGRLVVSKIYDWFSEDFGNNEADTIAHIRQYAEPGLAAMLEGRDDIDDYEYDWSLNQSR